MDLDLTIEMLQSIQVNPDDFDEIKEVKDLLILKRKLFNDSDELENKIKYNEMLQVLRRTNTQKAKAIGIAT